MGINYERAVLLFRQSRFELAEKELRQELINEPDQAPAHTLLALCLAQREKYNEATESAERAVALAPDFPHAYYGLAKVLLKRSRHGEAAKAIGEAIRLYPEEADFYALLAGIRFDQRDWPASLEAADRGLQLDPEHSGCNNLRAMALVKLGRRAEAGATIESALAREPENAVTHANQGWALMEKRDYDNAMHHFREALRLDPTSDWARAGIVEALKAKHLIYSLMLSYFLWMSKLSSQVQIALLVGGWLGSREISKLADQNPAWAPLLWIIIAFYVGFALMTWLASPLFNLALRLNKTGRLALSRDQIVASNWVGLGLFLALGWVAAWAVTGSENERIGALFFGVMLIPLAGTVSIRSGWPRTVMAVYTAGLYATACYLMWLFHIKISSREEVEVLSARAESILNVYTYGLILSGWIANGLGMVELKK